MKLVTLMHGLPSSGKSTLAQNIKNNNDINGLRTKIIETDEFFTKNNEYKWDATQIHVAHQWAYQKYCDALKTNIHHIIVSNTNLTWKEIKPYCISAYMFGYTVELMEPNTDWKDNIDLLVELSQKTHRVPRETFERMKAKKQSIEYLREKIRMLDIEGYEW